MARTRALLRALGLHAAFACGIVTGCYDEPAEEGEPLYIPGSLDLTDHCIARWGDAYCAEKFGAAAPYCMKPGCGGQPRSGCVAEVPVPDCRSSCGYYLVEYQDDGTLLRIPGVCADPDRESEEIPVLGLFWIGGFLWVAVASIGLAVVTIFVAGLKKAFSRRRRPTAPTSPPTTVPAPVVAPAINANMDSQAVDPSEAPKGKEAHAAGQRDK